MLITKSQGSIPAGITINLHNIDYSLQLKISIIDEKIFAEWFNELINEHKHNKMKQFNLKEYLKNPKRKSLEREE